MSRQNFLFTNVPTPAKMLLLAVLWISPNSWVENWVARIISWLPKWFWLIYFNGFPLRSLQIASSLVLRLLEQLWAIGPGAAFGGILCGCQSFTRRSSAWNGRPWPGRSQNWMLMYFIINLSGSQQFSGSSIQNQIELSEWATGRFMHWRSLWTIRKCAPSKAFSVAYEGDRPLECYLAVAVVDTAWLPLRAYGFIDHGHRTDTDWRTFIYSLKLMPCLSSSFVSL